MTAFWAPAQRDVLRVAGADALTYLQGQVSQDLRPLAVGASTWTLLLQPTGKVDVLARVWRTAEETFVLDTDAGYGEAMATRLRRFMIRVAVELEPLGWPAIAVRGVGEQRPDDAVAGWWGRDFDVLGPTAELGAAVPEGTAADLERARVEAGWPAMGAEIVPGETIPAETGVVAVAVDFRKGCYPGQELVERMESRGATAPRRLRTLTVADGARPGDPVVDAEGRQVGVLTSVAGMAAIASVRRGVELGAEPGSLTSG